MSECVSPVKTGTDVKYEPHLHARREAADHFPYHTETHAHTNTHTLSGLDDVIFFPPVSPPVSQSNTSSKPTAQEGCWL